MAAPTAAYLHELDSMDTVYVDTHGPHGFGVWIREHTFNAVLFSISWCLLLTVISLTVYICQLKYLCCFNGGDVIKTYDVGHGDNGSNGHGDDSPDSGSLGSEDALHLKARKSLSSSHIEGPSRTGRAMHGRHGSHGLVGRINAVQLAVERVHSHSAYERIISPRVGSVDIDADHNLQDLPPEDEYSVTFECRPFGMVLSSLARDEHNLYVSKVDALSVAGRHGIAVGDKIVALNGEGIEGNGASTVYDQVTKSEMPLTITFRRRFKRKSDVQNQAVSGEVSPVLGAIAVNMMDDIDSMDSMSAEELFAPGTPVDAHDPQGKGPDDVLKLSVIEEKEDSLASMESMDASEVGLLIDANANSETVGSLRAPSHERTYSKSILGAVGKLTRSISNSQKMKSIAQQSYSDSDEQAMSEGDEQ